MAEDEALAQAVRAMADALVRVAEELKALREDIDKRDKHFQQALTGILLDRGILGVAEDGKTLVFKKIRPRTIHASSGQPFRTGEDVEERVGIFAGPKKASGKFRAAGCPKCGSKTEFDKRRKRDECTNAECGWKEGT